MHYSSDRLWQRGNAYSRPVNFPFGPKFHEALKDRPRPSQSSAHSPTQSVDTPTHLGTAELQHDYSKLTKRGSPVESAEKHAKMLAAAEAVRSRRRSHKAKVDPMTPRSTQDSPDVAPSSPCSDTHTSDPATGDYSQGTMSLHRRKSAFVSTLMKRSDKDSNLFSGTD